MRKGSFQQKSAFFAQCESQAKQFTEYRVLPPLPPVPIQPIPRSDAPWLCKANLVPNPESRAAAKAKAQAGPDPAVAAEVMRNDPSSAAASVPTIGPDSSKIYPRRKGPDHIDFARVSLSSSSASANPVSNPSQNQGNRNIPVSDRVREIEQLEFQQRKQKRDNAATKSPFAGTVKQHTLRHGTPFNFKGSDLVRNEYSHFRNQTVLEHM